MHAVARLGTSLRTSVLAFSRHTHPTPVAMPFVDRESETVRLRGSSLSDPLDNAASAGWGGVTPIEDLAFVPSEDRRGLPELRRALRLG